LLIPGDTTAVNASIPTSPAASFLILAMPKALSIMFTVPIGITKSFFDEGRKSAPVIARRSERRKKEPQSAEDRQLATGSKSNIGS
jgi:hypothetical protein